MPEHHATDNVILALSILFEMFLYLDLYVKNVKIYCLYF
jgi:hypothetical protein